MNCAIGLKDISLIFSRYFSPKDKSTLITNYVESVDLALTCSLHEMFTCDRITLHYETPLNLFGCLSDRT